MTRTIASETSANKRYFLTIDDHSAHAVDCSCSDRTYRHHTCKHMSQFNQELVKTETFRQLWHALDFRSEAQRAARREAYCIDFAIYG